jgi:hypothetical protein
MASQYSTPNEAPVFFGGIRVDISQFDFSNHSSRVTSVTTTCAVFIALVVLTVGLRLFARRRYVGRIFADDGKRLLCHIRSRLMCSSPHFFRRSLHRRSSCGVYCR